MEVDTPDWLSRWRSSGFKFDQSHPDFISRNAIEVAALNGDIIAFRFIQQEVPEVYNFYSRQGESVLYSSVQKNHVAFVDYVLNNGGKHLLNFPQKHGRTPLWAAIFRSRSATMVKLLLFRGACLTAPSFSPLAEMRYATQVQEFLLPLHDWLIKMQIHSMQMKPFLAHRTLSEECFWLTGQDFFGMHILSFLNAKDCALLQAVSKDMQGQVQHRLDRYSIVLYAVEEFHPSLKSGRNMDDDHRRNSWKYRVTQFGR